MKVYLFPADVHGCGHFRMIWPAIALKEQGHDVVIVMPGQRDNVLAGALDDKGNMVDVRVPADADLIVFQRVTHKNIADAVQLIRNRGIAVAIDMDDDLTTIHPDNPAYGMLHPRMGSSEHSWAYALDACRDASAVIVSTPALIKRYAPHGRGYVFENFIPEHYFDVPHFDNATIGWAGSLHSHPNDLFAMGSSVNQLTQEGYQFAVIGDIKGIHQAWGVDKNVPIMSTGPQQIGDWPAAVANLGVGVAPLADTKFNAAKSHLKMLEYAALGIPCIGSDRVEYRRLHQRGVGWLAKDANDWKRKMKKLADDPIARHELAEQGLVTARDMAVRKNAWRLAELWAEAVKNERGKALGVHSRRKQS